jgi:hypothetical protein
MEQGPAKKPKTVAEVVESGDNKNWNTRGLQATSSLFKS